jgi:phosphoadenosine phosphosulfate reductase
VVTGVRAAESSKRAGRQMVEHCLKGGNKRYVHPILDWTDADVWEYIGSRGLPVNPLYARGYRRIGCILCPMSRETERDRQACPRLYEAWHRAVVRCWERRVAEGRPVVQASGEEMWRWWLDRDAAASGSDEPSLFG